MNFSGEILAGEFDRDSDAFILQQVKQLSTSSSLNKDQFDAIYHYLIMNQDDTGGQVLSLNDQLLVRLNQEELQNFIADLDRIKNIFWT
ncbi:hypothetical protein GCM10007216_05520 [Thalassobacillus devorans]|uniref:Uncharacterized protein n=1 Tax=Thalassobacillus devorans TaxID=279813 RepID=A0ABQ1NI46_9BACI|nr:hypothetical protein [Thalassobacillus devorans]NIK27460.1 Glu-tRNA(Gln) amidotransferase subunit E-like FAD-binding protein [Thalassobacillus devorans]GGC77890.1 hypothetical protein GCM10007216_05520 [Thalassobacillus devorans]